MKHAIAMLALLVCVCSQAATNLAVTCTGTPSGSSCRPHVYAYPSPTTLVWSNGQWKPFSTADQVQVCATEVTPGSVSSERDGSPCSSWSDLPASQVPVPVVPGRNMLELTWTAPTKNCAGNPLAAGDLLGYRIAWGTLLSQPNTVDVGLVTSYTLTGLPAGSITTTIESRGPDGSTCGKAGPLTANTKAPVSTEAAPTNLRVADLTVYDLAKATNKLSLTSVGTVPANTSCIASTVAPAGYAVVDRAKVQLAAGKTRPLVVVARCQ